MKRLWLSGVDKELFGLLLLSNLVSVALLAVRVLVTNNMRLTFLAFNLFLAWLPMIFAWWLTVRLRIKKIPGWKEAILGILWLGFLPNSFYLVTDLIHLQSSGEVSLLYDTALITSFVLNGLLLGYLSLYFVQRALTRLTSERFAFIFAQICILLSAFAIYLGRYLRWNTWDIILNPLGLAFDISDRIINPGSYQLTFVVTGVFFVMLGAFYAVIYRLITLLHRGK